MLNMFNDHSRTTFPRMFFVFMFGTAIQYFFQLFWQTFFRYFNIVAQAFDICSRSYNYLSNNYLNVAKLAARKCGVKF